MSKEWAVEDLGLANSLAEDFNQGAIGDSSGRRLLKEDRVATISGLTVSVFANEHPPPHFRVSYAGETANFAIKDCARINGGLDRWLRNIQRWHKSNKDKLIQVWNSTRPADCPVGEYRED